MKIGLARSALRRQGGKALTADGRRLRILNVIDDVTKESLAAVVDTSISGRRVARDITSLIARRGKPGVIVSDNAPN